MNELEQLTEEYRTLAAAGLSEEERPRKLRAFLREYVSLLDLEAYYADCFGEAEEAMRRVLSNGPVYYRGEGTGKTYAVKPERLGNLFKGGYRWYFDMGLFVSCCLEPGSGDIAVWLMRSAQQRIPLLQEAMEVAESLGDANGEWLLERVENAMHTAELPEIVMYTVAGRFDTKTVKRLLRENPYYASFFETERLEADRRAALRHNIVTRIPAQYRDLWPETRRMHRHFVIHSGPTNSGKTYAGMEALKQAPNGVYLAPLRMLALEKYDELNEAGFPCDLLTGEERKQVENSRYTASTIEMADFDTHYECAVIDECQLVTDSFRGGAWTAAILGLQADVIHVCLSPWAEGIISTMIDECGDSRELVRHERQTELLAEKAPVKFPRDVKEHDALIVFSRRDVHATAAELERHGISCSLIYGSLPYDVRQNEAKRFRSGETQVVVSTDAIGMGLNLPIQRVVFLRMEKFDGTEQRRLNSEEIRQIAGRAGRRGIYEKGFAAATNPTALEAVREAISSYHAPAVEPMIGFPRTLLGVEGTVSSLIREWNRIPPLKGYRKQNLDEQLLLAEKAEKQTGDKLLVYRLAMIPVDTKNEELLTVWQELARCTAKGLLEHAPVPQLQLDAELRDLELTFRVYDLYFQFGRVFGVERLQKEASECKEQVSEKIMELMVRSGAGRETKKCRFCGRELPWNYGFNVCERCYRSRRGRRY